MKTIEYRGFKISKTGRAAWDNHIAIGQRQRWGTIEELKTDIDSHLDGLGLPAKQKGFA